uniref:Uncharacterized protein n=1 Tax=Daphnia galeata TaxID=27404 RepID=A0A8J2RHE9_9CRUS|nr:unnamed protein product [Daphnia galeata]
MDSDDEDVSENDILDWYKSEVADIWDTATDSAFADLSSNFTDMFRQVMNDVKQRSQASRVPNGHAVEVNGHSSEVNGVSDPQASTEPATNTVSVSSDQLMAMLQDEDEDWLEESNNPLHDEEPMVLSVQLTDSQNPQTEEDQKNVKGVSQESNHLADSILLLSVPHHGTALQFFMLALKFLFYFFIILNALYTSPPIHKPLQKWFHKNVQDYIYPSMRQLLLWYATHPLIQSYPFLTDLHEETCLISSYPLYGYVKSSCSPVTAFEQENMLIDELSSGYYDSDILILMKSAGVEVALKDIKHAYSKNSKQLLQGIGGFKSNQYPNFNSVLEHPSKFLRQDLRAYWKGNRVGSTRLFRNLYHLSTYSSKRCSRTVPTRWYTGNRIFKRLAHIK